MSTMPRPRLGISSCLLGSSVRYDGGHKRNEFLLETLRHYVDWISVCPEVDIGLGTPRPPIQLEFDGAHRLRLVMPETGDDLTDRMIGYAHDKVSTLWKMRLSGYVLKSKSPSCGMEQVLVHDGNHDPAPVGVGLFAAVLIRRMPHLPVEEEGRLDDPCFRENFVARIFARARWLALEDAGFTVPGVIRFHAQHRYLLMSRDPNAVGTLDDLLGEADDRQTDAVELAEKYEWRFSEALSRPPNRENHANVLQRMADHEPEGIESEDRDGLRRAIDGYRAGNVSLNAPVQLLRQHVAKYRIESIADQAYLEPHPNELSLLREV